MPQIILTEPNQSPDDMNAHRLSFGRIRTDTGCAPFNCYSDRDGHVETKNSEWTADRARGIISVAFVQKSRWGVNEYSESYQWTNDFNNGVMPLAPMVESLNELRYEDETANDGRLQGAIDGLIAQLTSVYTQYNVVGIIFVSVRPRKRFVNSEAVEFAWMCILGTLKAVSMFKLWI